MKRVLFVDKRTETRIGLISTCAEFMTMCENVPLKQREFVIGRPYKKAYGIALFQNSWLGKVNPYWVKIFRCYGPEITIPEARDRFRSQLPIPLDQRPSQNQDKFRQESLNKSRRPRRKSAKVPREILQPSSDYSRTGQALYQNPYGGGYQNLHVVSSRSTTKNSVNTPNFKSLKKRDIPWHPFSFELILGREDPGSQRFDYVDKTYSVYSGYVRGTNGFGKRIQDAIGLTNYSVDRTQADALNKALSRAKASSVNIAQAYAERRQTVSLIITSVNRLIHLARALRQGNVAGARRLINGSESRVVSKRYAVWNSTGTHVIGRRYGNVVRPGKPKNPAETFANLWLEFQYGWKPMLSDIYGSCEHLANSLNAPKRVRASATSEQRIVSPQTIFFAGSEANEVGSLVTYQRSHVVLEFQEATNLAQQLSQTGISNPALLAWELLPYSFVVDWFVPIGTYLGNLDAMVGLNFLRGSTTTRQTVTYESKMVNRGTVKTFSCYGSNLYVSRSKKNRTIYSTVPNPPLPYINPSLGVERALSAISLLTQLLTKGKTTVRL